MSIPRLMSAHEAVNLIQNQSTVCFAGFMSFCMPETIYKAIESSYLNTGSPKDLTLVFGAGQSLKNGCGLDHFAHKGLVKKVIGGHWNLMPALAEMAKSGQFEAYNLPQGVIARLLREIAAHGPGVITKTGLHTFVDPRLQGGRINKETLADIVQVIELGGEEWLYYKAFPVDVAIIRGTYADEAGNISFEKEAICVDVCSAAQAAHNSGGLVIVQVEKIVQKGSLDPWKVKIPGNIVDAIVLADSPEDQAQCFGRGYDGSLNGEYRKKGRTIETTPLNIRKIIGRRAALELEKGKIINLGVGMPEQVAIVAAEEDCIDEISLTIESGAIGGRPCSGNLFGSSVNVEAIVDQAVQFDFYNGGGIDIAFLGLAQVDQSGNVNVSCFGQRQAGCGGFIDISQNSKKVVFCGTFTAKGLEVKVDNGELKIITEGTSKKFLREVEQITFCGKAAEQSGNEVIYITERAVFKLHNGLLELTEIAPGIDLHRDILAQMNFKPVIANDLKLMDERLFLDRSIGLPREIGNG